MLVALVVIAVVAVGMGAFFWARSRSADPAVSLARKEVSRQKKALKEATKAHTQALANVTRDLERATRAHSIDVAQRESHLRQLRDPKGRALGSYQGIRLYERWIETPHGSGHVGGTVASVDAQVSSRITATRLVTIGVFALAAKKKTGAVYLSIENPDVASVIECSQEDNTKAREFAVKITNAGKAAAAIEARLPDLILSAEQAVTTAVSDTAAIDAAQAELSRVEADPLLVGPIETAQVALTAAESKLKDLTAAAA